MKPKCTRASGDDKLFLGADGLVMDAFRLARRIFDSGYRPEAILALWRGGTPVGVAIHEFFLYKGVDTWHSVVKVESYTGIGRRRSRPRMENLAGVIQGLPHAANILVVDDIFDSGRTVEAVCDQLADRTRNVKIATLYYKPASNVSGRTPDFYLHMTDRWVVFPHELVDLSMEEIRRKNPELEALLR